MGGSIVGCEIELKSGCTCGVQAIGRCATCERAFCLTHQRQGFVGPYIDMCVECVAKAEADKEEQQRTHQAKVHEARKYVESGAARTALITADVPSVEIYELREYFETKWWLGRRYGWVENVAAIRRGWILGTFNWTFYGSNSNGAKTHYTGNCLTALVELEPGYPLTATPVNRFVKRGKLCYDDLGRGGVDGWKNGAKAIEFAYPSEWAKAAEAIKRLIKESRS